jgi:hypothetical protein
VITLAALQQATRTILANAGESQYSDDELTLYINWALNDFTAYCPAVSDVDYTNEVDGSTATFPLPDNVYSIDLVKVDSVGFIEEYDAKPGVGLPASNAKLAYRRRGGLLVFNTAPENPFTVHYDAYYDRLSEGTPANAPRWAEEALAYYAAAAALSGKSAGSASIDQWDQQWDSGNPEHNPLARMAEAFQERYIQIVHTHTQNAEIQTWRPTR